MLQQDDDKDLYTHRPGLDAALTLSFVLLNALIVYDISARCQSATCHRQLLAALRLLPMRARVRARQPTAKAPALPCLRTRDGPHHRFCSPARQAGGPRAVAAAG